MHWTNPKPKRTFEDALCVIGVINPKGVLLRSEVRDKVHFGEYAKQAYAEFGPCRVAFKPAGSATWREVRWKNKNSGTMYRRPSLMTLPDVQVPAVLKLMAMIGE